MNYKFKDFKDINKHKLVEFSVGELVLLEDFISKNEPGTDSSIAMVILKRIRFILNTETDNKKDLVTGR